MSNPLFSNHMKIGILSTIAGTAIAITTLIVGRMTNTDLFLYGFIVFIITIGISMFQRYSNGGWKE